MLSPWPSILCSTNMTIFVMVLLAVFARGATGVPESEGCLSATGEHGTSLGWERESSMEDRAYLNTLVEASVLATGAQTANIAFVKTHKTGSTTLASILYRYAARHGVKLAHFGEESNSKTVTSLQDAVDQVLESGELLDIMHYHISAQGRYFGPWYQADQQYRDIMRDHENVNFVTLLREPRSHLISHYYFYMQPDTRMSLVEYLETTEDQEVHARLADLQLSEFGVRSYQGADKVLLVEMILSGFKLVIPTERLNEGLLLLRRMMNWDMIDMTYVRMNETKDGGIRRWDQKPLVNAPHFNDLPKEVQDTIDRVTKGDKLLYEAAKEHFDQRLAGHLQSLQTDAASFQCLQEVVRRYLDGNSSSKANIMYRKHETAYVAPVQLYPF